MSIIFDPILISVEGCFKLHTVISKESNLQIKHCFENTCRDSLEEIEKGLCGQNGTSAFYTRRASIRGELHRRPFNDMRCLNV